jgi:hypothetical protein
MLLRLLTGAALLVPATGATQVPDAEALAQNVVAEAVSFTRTFGLPPEKPRPIVLIDFGSVQEVFGLSIDERVLLRVAGPGARVVSRGDAVRCAQDAQGRRQCSVVHDGIHIHLESLSVAGSRADVVVTSTYTERRRQSSMAGFLTVRFSFEADADGVWHLVESAPLSMS